MKTKRTIYFEMGDKTGNGNEGCNSHVSEIRNCSIVHVSEIRNCSIVHVFHNEQWQGNVCVGPGGERGARGQETLVTGLEPS